MTERLPIDWEALYASWPGRLNRHDCWKLCQGAHRCCRPEGQTLLLAPGEGEFLRRKGLPAVGDELQCAGREHCYGELRPICCRTFPFHPGPNGELLANTACSQHRWASWGFIEEVEFAWQVLLADPHVRAWAERMRRDHYSRMAETPLGRIHREFDAGYTANFGQYVNHETPKELHLAGVLREGDRVLDVGCGQGTNVAALVTRGVDAWGVDVNPALIERSLAPTRCQLGDARKLPFGDGAFDLVYCVDVLEHLLDYEAAFAEMLRVSRRDVYVRVTTTEDLGSLLEDPTHVVRMSTAEWQARAPERVRLVGSSPATPRDPAGQPSVQNAHRTLMGFMRPADGYGIAVRTIGGLLQREGWTLTDMLDACREALPVPDQVWWEMDEPTVAMCGAEWLQHIAAPKGMTLFTMFEATRLPKKQVEMMNWRAQQVIVPCDWCAETFAASGVMTPIAVAGLGVDPADFPLIDRSRHDGPYTFVWSGTPDRRKGWDVTYQAFWKAFGGDTDVRLVMHFRQLPRSIKGCADANVELVEGRLSDEQRLALLARADAFVFPSRGEGWGQPPREAAMTGLPTIATNWSGLAAGIEHWALPLRVARLSEARFGFWDDEDLGEWAEPDVDHLVERMRWCVEHRTEAAAFGMSAAGWLREHATWEETAQRVAAVAG